MFSFCQHCGGSIGQDQVVGKKIICRHCKKELGVVSDPSQEVKYIDKTEELLASGKVARCPECLRLVEVREKKDARGWRRSMAPHMGAGPSRICIFSGKPAPAPPAEATPPPPIQRPATSKDLSKFMTHETVKVVGCTKIGDPTIEVLALDYLDPRDRVRIQIDAVRELLGGVTFRMTAYPAPLRKPHLSVWATPTACVVAKRSTKGGFEPMPDGELPTITEDLTRYRKLFFS